MGLFGSKFPATDKLEKQEAEYKRLYQEVLATANSEDLKEYFELKDEVNSPEFVHEKLRITKLKWKNTKEFRELKEYTKLTKNKDLRAYLNLKGSNELDTFLKFKTSDAYRDIADPKKRKAAPELKQYHKFEQSKGYKSYQKTDGSGMLKQYENLKERIESEAFKSHKAFCEDKHRWNNTEGAQKEKRLKELEGDTNIQNYIKYHNSDVFDLFKNYEVTFDEDFAPEKLDTQKWDTEFFLSAEYGKGNYSKMEYINAFTKGRNIDISRDFMTIDTRAESTNARIWDPEHGFIQKNLNFTSGVLSTGKSFKQNQGLFKVKLKTDSRKPVAHSVQLISKKGNIQIKLIQVSKTGKPMVGISVYDGHRHTVRTTRVKGLDLNANFHIFSFEWQNEMLIWKINDKEVFRTEIKLPKEDLFLELASMIYKTKKSPAPGRLIVDWVKVYKKSA